MSIGDGLSVFSVCSIIVTAIIKFVPRRENIHSNSENGNANVNGNGKYVTLREFDSFRINLGDSINEIKSSVRELERMMKSRQ